MTPGGGISPLNQGQGAPGIPSPPPGFGPPPPPIGYGPQVTMAPARRSSAGWALALTILGAVGLIGLALIWTMVLMKGAIDKVGPNATQAQLQQAFNEQIYSKGDAQHLPGLALAGVAAMLASIGGLVLAARSLVRQEPGRGMAIAACILGGVFLFCQVLTISAMVGPRPAG